MKFKHTISTSWAVSALLLGTGAPKSTLAQSSPCSSLSSLIDYTSFRASLEDFLDSEQVHQEFGASPDAIQTLEVAVEGLENELAEMSRSTTDQDWYSVKKGFHRVSTALSHHTLTATPMSQKFQAFTQTLKPCLQ